MESTNRTCRWVCRRLSLLAGGDLDGLERRRVERHLIGCPTCQDHRAVAAESLAVLREVAALGPMGAGIADPGVSPSIWPALARQIREAKHQPERLSVVGWVRSLVAPPPLAWASAGMVAVLLCLGLGWSWMGGPGDQTGSIAPLVVVATPDRSVMPPSFDRTIPEPLVDESGAAIEPSVVPADWGNTALPGEIVVGNRATPKPTVDPFAPPIPLRLDYDLDWWTLSGPLADTQRAY